MCMIMGYAISIIFLFYYNITDCIQSLCLIIILIFVVMHDHVDGIIIGKTPLKLKVVVKFNYVILHNITLSVVQLQHIPT